jgi:hypothetical protein
MDSHFWCTVKIDSWDDLLTKYHWHAHTEALGSKGPSQWVFRGQRRADWPLQTSLERAAAEQQILCSPVPSPRIGKLEKFLLRKFRRECHRFGLSSIPADDDFLEWFAWMQHYGAPTRLLDCTYSFFVAVFFAVEEAGETHNGRSAVWALNSDAVAIAAKSLIRQEGSSVQWRQYCRNPDVTEKRTFSDLFMAKPPLRHAGIVNPFKLNERLVLQHGAFLCPGDVSVSFAENLRSVIAFCDAELQPVLIKYCITDDPAVRRDILRNLMNMNISRATLFPGLDGFARSLRQWLAFPEIMGHATPC